MTDTNPNDYPRLSIDDLSAHVTNILFHLDIRKVHKADKLYILREAHQSLLRPS